MSTMHPPRGVFNAGSIGAGNFLWITRAALVLDIGAAREAERGGAGYSAVTA